MRIPHTKKKKMEIIARLRGSSHRNGGKRGDEGEKGRGKWMWTRRLNRDWEWGKRVTRGIKRVEMWPIYSICTKVDDAVVVEGYLLVMVVVEAFATRVAAVVKEEVNEAIVCKRFWVGKGEDVLQI